MRAMTKSSPKLLVVDDIKDWQKTIGGVLRDMGYDVSVTGTMTGAIKMLEKDQYDLTLLDLRLDETDEDNVDGLKLAEIIRNRWPEVKIVLITGYGTQDALQRSMKPRPGGRRLVDDYLPKESTDKLAETVRQVLAR